MEEDQNDTLGRTLISIATTNRRRTRQFFSFRETDRNEPIEYDESFEGMFVYIYNFGNYHHL